MTGAWLVMMAVGVTFPLSQDGEVRFSATIDPQSDLAISTHDLGSGVLAHVATYREHHTAEMRNETVEILAYATDHVSFDAATQLVATRSGPDLQEIPTRIARAYFGSTRQ